MADTEQLTQLRQLLANRFSDGELRTLCFDLGVDYEGLPGAGKADKARELVAYMERRGQLTDLVRVGRGSRPDVLWPAMDAPSAAGPSPANPPTAPQASQMNMLIIRLGMWLGDIMLLNLVLQPYFAGNVTLSRCCGQISASQTASEASRAGKPDASAQTTGLSMTSTVVVLVQDANVGGDWLKRTFADMKRKIENTIRILDMPEWVTQHLLDATIKDNDSAQIIAATFEAIKGPAVASLFMWGYLRSRTSASLMGIIALEENKPELIPGEEITPLTPLMEFLVDHGIPSEHISGLQNAYLSRNEKLVNNILDQIESQYMAKLNTAPGSQPPPTAASPALRAIKRKALEKRLADLGVEHEAASSQLGYALAAVDRLRIQRQIEALEAEIGKVDAELAALR